MTDITPPLLPLTDSDAMKGHQDGCAGRFPSLRSDPLADGEFACVLADENEEPDTREGEC